MSGFTYDEATHASRIQGHLVKGREASGLRWGLAHPESPHAVYSVPAGTGLLLAIDLYRPDPDDDDRRIASRHWLPVRLEFDYHGVGVAWAHLPVAGASASARLEITPAMTLAVPAGRRWPLTPVARVIRSCGKTETHRRTTSATA